VQPDVLVVCDPDKVKSRGIFGAPDLIIEILSPSSGRRDRWDKKALYEKYGVKEYLLFDPDGKYAEQYVLEESGKFSSGEAFDQEAKMILNSLDGLELPLDEIFMQDENAKKNDS
jgi:Uma2 family endonuclease